MRYNNLWSAGKGTYNNYIFVPFAVETFGSWCSEAKALISTVGRSLVQLSGDPRSSQYLRQRIGIAIQRGTEFRGVIRRRYIIFFEWRAYILPSMLSKYLHDKNQNANESFNGFIWRRCHKETYVGRTTLKLGIMDVICHFNYGNKVELDIFRKMSTTPGRSIMAGVNAADETFLSNSREDLMKRFYKRINIFRVPSSELCCTQLQCGNFRMLEVLNVTSIHDNAFLCPRHKESLKLTWLFLITKGLGDLGLGNEQAKVCGLPDQSCNPEMLASVNCNMLSSSEQKVNVKQIVTNERTLSANKNGDAFPNRSYWYRMNCKSYKRNERVTILNH
ncbi:hypothetical protein ANN_16124 [Periplaneta americana]|uniref:Uncharacterized protein n=1 Tax=Periplaneta americana TaxID=6978 RepID=A0ABQ8SI87_PERAM|nr:hypothetical protein ANN_16124 [Periplaneta americana]